jgi:hypothetical protein
VSLGPATVAPRFPVKDGLAIVLFPVSGSEKGFILVESLWVPCSRPAPAGLILLPKQVRMRSVPSGTGTGIVRASHSTNSFGDPMRLLCPAAALSGDARCVPPSRRSRARRLCRYGVLVAGCFLFAGAAAWALDRAAWESQRVPPSSAPVVEAIDVTLPGYPTIRNQRFPEGTAAPDFELPDVRDGHLLRLSGLQGRPVVLVFGSFGCDRFCGQAGELAQLHSRYKDRAQFLFVYVVEAPHEHPVLPPPWGGTFADDPEKAQKERIRIGFDLYGLTMPCLDDRENEAVEVYGAWPRRLVVVDACSRIAYDAGPGMTTPKWDLDAVAQVLDRLPARRAEDKPLSPL